MKRKNRKSRDKQKRSAAAKKGWQTRRKRERKEERAARKKDLDFAPIPALIPHKHDPAREAYSRRAVVIPPLDDWREPV